VKGTGKRHLLFLIAFAVAGFAVMGYHPGLEDDGVYLAAVKSDLNPALYPYDSQFFRVQLQATVFDKLIAEFVRLTHIPVPYTELLWQLGALLLIVYGCWAIARRLFDDERAHWAGVAMVSAMFTLPVAGTALVMADQHLHPRSLATGLILIAVERILAGKRWQAVPLLVLAFALHPIMAALGISFCLFLTMATLEPVHAWLRSWRGTLAAAAPLAWIFEPPSPSWRLAVNTRPSYFFLTRWHWYELLGAVAPLVLFWLLGRWALKRRETLLARFAFAVFAYGVFQQAVALAIAASPALVRLLPLQPMRYLHLVYFFLALMAGCLLGKTLLKSSVWRWAVYLIVINAGMLISQVAEYPGEPHLELPGMKPGNAWLEAFAWVKQNTPVNAYFALDPLYMAVPGEDYHSFRALAERSVLADYIKDASLVTQVPELGPEWARQNAAAAGWPRFHQKDFERLKTEFGVDWVLVNNSQRAGLDCLWNNASFSVCRIP
jgi:hypothetical protein